MIKNLKMEIPCRDTVTNTSNTKKLHIEIERNVYNMTSLSLYTMGGSFSKGNESLKIALDKEGLNSLIDSLVLLRDKND